MTPGTGVLTRRLVLLLAWAGTAAFALLLAIACLRPATVEAWGKEAIAGEVRQHMAAHAPGLANTDIVREAARRATVIATTMTSTSTTAARLKAQADAKYAQVSQSLLRELRIFSAANAFVFLLLALIASFWRRSGQQLLAPAAVLLGAALLVGCTYAFSQDWLQTILLGDYVGLWYFPYLLVAIAFMLDVVFNRARVSKQLVQVTATVAGAVVSGAGC